MSAVLERKISEGSRLDLFSIRRFEALVGRSFSEIRLVADKAGAYYKPFPKPPKRRWFPNPNKPASNKTREIDNPQNPLKEIQSRILARMLEQIELPGYVKGGVKGRSLSHNIELHAGAATLVTIDIKSFFPSITPRHVYWIWRYRLNCCPKFAAILTRLTTFEGRLPQGAPTSTYLANLLIASIDGEIVRACRQTGVTYSTWVDDLAFSGADARLVIQTVIDVLRHYGFSVSHRKLRVMGRADRRILNGVIAGLRLSVPREFRNAIRSGTHKLRTGLVVREEFESYVKSMHGTIDHVSRFNKRLAERLREDFGSEVIASRKRLNMTTPISNVPARARSARA